MSLQTKKLDPHERFEKYKGNECWQFHLRERHYWEDLELAGMTHEDAQRLRTSDFIFEYVPKTDKKGCQEIVKFIERHEWLGKMPIWLTHRFVCRLNVKGMPRILAGVIIMATPNAFSNILGKEMREKEKLISRGACISWSPKNLGSNTIMKAIKWMVANTDFRFFTAYSDPDAKELGTIYQACSFHYLGQVSGTKYQFYVEGKGWRGDKSFSERSAFVRYAKELGYTWKKEWLRIEKGKRRVKWSEIPEDITVALKQKAKDTKNACPKRLSPPKHKYVFVLGRGKKETKHLRKLLHENSPPQYKMKFQAGKFSQVLVGYPKERGK
ncbi:MAG: hypothetical protein E2O88_11900 [Bacteroidetes bacterium]|nr:MAG: hypothetical protein E2O88_11900 [Bacteroidota bacterium]